MDGFTIIDGIVAAVIIVILSVLGGFVLSHGKLGALWQPYEVLIICGAAFGAFLVANPLKVVKGALLGIPGLLKGARYKRSDYVDILSMIYDVLVKARKEGKPLKGWIKTPVELVTAENVK